MIGFKKVPTKLVLSAFFISIIFILLLYTDTVLNKPLPEEEIKITKNFDDPLPIIKNKLMHQVRKGESLSVIFEEKKVPLNTAYKIFNADKNNVLASINPDDIMEFNYLGDELSSIEIKKDKTNSIVIQIEEKSRLYCISSAHSRGIQVHLISVPHFPYAGSDRVSALLDKLTHPGSINQ